MLCLSIKEFDLFCFFFFGSRAKGAGLPHVFLEAAHLAGFGPKKTSMACLPGRKKSRGAAGGDFPMEQQLEHLFPELLRKVWDHLGSTRQVIAAVTPVSKALRDVLFATMTTINLSGCDNITDAAMTALAANCATNHLSNFLHPVEKVL